MFAGATSQLDSSEVISGDDMLKLYGVAVSNYFNIVKLALLEKEIPCETVVQIPTQEASFLRISPLGKIPVLETPDGFIAESLAILRYLDLTYPEKPLFPTDALAAARALQIHCMIDQTIDPPARELLSAAFFGGTTTAEAMMAVGEKLAHNIQALARVAVFDPFIAGTDLTHADLAAYNTLQFCADVLLKLNQADPLQHLSGWPAYREGMDQRPAFAKVDAERKAAVAAFLQSQQR